MKSMCLAITFVVFLSHRQKHMCLQADVTQPGSGDEELEGSSSHQNEWQQWQNSLTKAHAQRNYVTPAAPAISARPPPLPASFLQSSPLSSLSVPNTSVKPLFSSIKKDSDWSQGHDFTSRPASLFYRDGGYVRRNASLVRRKGKKVSQADVHPEGPASPAGGTHMAPRPSSNNTDPLSFLHARRTREVSSEITAPLTSLYGSLKKNNIILMVAVSFPAGLLSGYLLIALLFWWRHRRILCCTTGCERKAARCCFCLSTKPPPLVPRIRGSDRSRLSLVQVSGRHYSTQGSFANLGTDRELKFDQLQRQFAEDKIAFKISHQDPAYVDEVDDPTESFKDHPDLSKHEYLYRRLKWWLANDRVRALSGNSCEQTISAPDSSPPPSFMGNTTNFFIRGVDPDQISSVSETRRQTKIKNWKAPQLTSSKSPQSQALSESQPDPFIMKLAQAQLQAKQRRVLAEKNVASDDAEEASDVDSSITGDAEQDQTQTPIRSLPRPLPKTQAQLQHKTSDDKEETEIDSLISVETDPTEGIEEEDEAVQQPSRPQKR